MTTQMTIAIEEPRMFKPGPIPTQAAMIISSLEAGHHGLSERRAIRRNPYRIGTQIRLFTDESADRARTLYTREANRRSLGFVTEHRLPLGYGGVIDLPDDDGFLARVHCTLLRCRETSPGWFEGSLYFNREQPQFDR